MGTSKRTRHGLGALAAGAAGIAVAAMANAPVAGAAGIFGAEPLAEGSTVALAQPVDGTRWNLVVVERLQPGTGCWQQQGQGLVSLEPDALTNETLCNRLQSSSGYSLRAAGQDLRSPWRLRIEAVDNRLELQAFNPSLSTPITIGTAPLSSNASALPAFTLNPGWSFQKRSYEGRLLSHVYLSSREPAAVLQARARAAGGSLTIGKLVAPPAVSVTAAASPTRTGPNPASLASRDPMPGQVIALQVVPFQDDTNLTTSN